MKKTLLAVLLLALAAPKASSQTTTYNSSEVSVNAGDQSWATFYFGHLPDGTLGSTALIIQCDRDRAELITNFDVFGMQMTSQFFVVTCSKHSGYLTVAYVLNSVPVMESLVMTGTDAHGNKVVQNLNLTINNASWKTIGYSRDAKSEGSAEVTY